MSCARRVPLFSHQKPYGSVGVVRGWLLLGGKMIRATNGSVGCLDESDGKVLDGEILSLFAGGSSF